MGAAHTTMSTLPPFERIRARRLARSRSPTSKANTSDVRAAVSYSNRHNSFSRKGTPRRRHNSSRSASGTARVLSTRRRRGPTPTSGSTASGHRSPHQLVNAWNATRRVFHVAGAQPSHRSATDGRHHPSLQVGHRLGATHCPDERVEGPAVGASGLRSKVTVSEEGLHRPRHRRHMMHRVIRLRRCGWGETDDTTHTPSSIAHRCDTPG